MTNAISIALISDDKEWGKALGLFVKHQTERLRLQRLLACSAVAMAAVHGRTEWLNQLYGYLPRLEQDAFRAWLSPTMQTFKPYVKDVTKPWLTFKAKADKDGEAAPLFRIANNTMEHRPTIEQVEAVANDEAKHWDQKPMRTLQRALDGPMAILQRLESVAKLVNDMYANPDAKDDKGNAKYDRVPSKPQLKAIDGMLGKTIEAVKIQLANPPKLIEVPADGNTGTATKPTKRGQRPAAAVEQAAA